MSQISASVPSHPTATRKTPPATAEDLRNDEDDDPVSPTTTIQCEDSEREVWEFMTPKAWHESVAAKDSIFRPTYQATIDTLRKTAEEGGYDVILEVGCGTGDIIGEMNTQQVCRRSSLLNLKGLLLSPDELVTGAAEDAENFVTIPCIGVDINKDFVDFCQTTHRKCIVFSSNCVRYGLSHGVLIRRHYTALHQIESNRTGSMIVA